MRQFVVSKSGKICFILLLHWEHTLKIYANAEAL